MTLEEQFWSELCKRCNYAPARTLARSVKMSRSYARELLNDYVKQNIVECKVIDGVKHYRIPK